jgi:hypothetical protein
MSNPSRVLLAFLLAMFTFNQVALAHLLQVAITDYETACFEHDTEDETSGLPLNIKQTLVKYVGCAAGFMVLYMQAADEQTGELLHRTSPHGLHVPIYLDHRALIV